MTIDNEKLLKAIVAESQFTSQPLELVVLDQCICLRFVKDRSHTLTAGSKNQTEAQQYDHIMEKISKKNSRYHDTFWHSSIPKFKTMNELLMRLTIKGLY